MSQYARNNPDLPPMHDAFAGAKTLTLKQTLDSMNTETLTQDANATLVAEDEKQLLAVVEQNHLQVDTSRSLQKQFAPFFNQARAVIEKSITIVVTNANQRTEIATARLRRLELKAIRVAGDKARKEIKEESLRRSKAIDGFGNILNDLIVTEETRLQAQEDFAEIQESNRKAALKTDREKILVSIQVDPNLYSLGEMSDETFQQLVEGTKLARAAEAERKRKEEADRIERDAKEQAERQRIRDENDRLKREADEKESARVAEVRRRGELHFARRIEMQPLVASGDESMNGFYGDMTDEQFGEAKAGAENRRAVRLQLERGKAEADERAAKEKESAARLLAEQKRIADEAALAERARVADEQRIAAEKARVEREAAEESIRKEAARLKAIADAELAAERKKAEETAEAARKEKLRLQALAEVERQKAETARKEVEAKAQAERDEHARKVREMEKAAAVLAAKEKAARDEIEAKVRAQREADERRIAAEKEAARKAAAAPDKDRLISYANAIRALEIPAFNTPEAIAIATTIAASRDRFAEWCEQKAFAL